VYSDKINGWLKLDRTKEIYFAKQSHWLFSLLKTSLFFNPCIDLRFWERIEITTTNRKSHLFARLKQSFKVTHLIVRSSVESERCETYDETLVGTYVETLVRPISHSAYRGTMSSFPSSYLPWRGSRRENTHIGDAWLCRREPRTSEIIPGQCQKSTRTRSRASVTRSTVRSRSAMLARLMTLMN